MLLLLTVFVAASGAFAIWYYRMKRRAARKALPIEQALLHEWTTDFLQSKVSKSQFVQLLGLPCSVMDNAYIFSCGDDVANWSKRCTHDLPNC